MLKIAQKERSKYESLVRSYQRRIDMVLKVSVGGIALILIVFVVLLLLFLVGQLASGGHQMPVGTPRVP